MLKAGLGYRPALKEGIFNFKEVIDCVEVISDAYLHLTSFQRLELKQLTEIFTVIPHGLRLSIGSVERPPQLYLDNIARLLEVICPPYYSEHFAITGNSNTDIGHLSPLWYTEEGLEQVINNVLYVQKFLGLPLVLEIITHPFEIPGSTISPEQFISTVFEQTGVGVLLDITNVFINAHNLGGNAKEFIKHLPREAVKQYHIVGYASDDEGVLSDTHSAPIQSDLWDLYDYALSVCPPDYVIIERDAEFPHLAELLKEINRLRTPNIS